MSTQTSRSGEVTAVRRATSFEEYVHSSGPRLKRLAFLLTGDLVEAEDLLQSAYAKALPHWRRVGSYDHPDAYLRAAVVLRHWCDLSEAQTAEAMGCSVGTVKSSTSKGLAHLRAALGRPTGAPADSTTGTSADTTRKGGAR